MTAAFDSYDSNDDFEDCGVRETVSRSIPSVMDEIILSRQDLLGEKRLANFSEEKSLEHLFPWAFIGFRLHRGTECIHKPHQSV